MNLTYSQTGISDNLTNSLVAFIQDETIFIKGLKEGETLNIYNNTGVKLYEGTSMNTETEIYLPGVNGIFIVQFGNRVVKLIKK